MVASCSLNFSMFNRMPLYPPITPLKSRQEFANSPLKKYIFPLPLQTSAASTLSGMPAKPSAMSFGYPSSIVVPVYLQYFAPLKKYVLPFLYVNAASMVPGRPDHVPAMDLGNPWASPSSVNFQ